MIRILVHLADGFEEMEAIVPADVWRRAGYIVRLVSVTGRLKVTGSHNISVMADQLFEDTDYNDADMIFLPGGMPGTSTLDGHKGLCDEIRKFDSKGKYLAAICAAPSVLGHLGLLKGKKATCFPGFEKELIGATVSSLPVEIDGKIITGKGAGAAMALALEVIAEISGQNFANELSAKMQVP
jgi:4-methyl-5(b-hydroxyethyl)-thiazole monophosphate biosynthesis